MTRIIGPYGFSDQDPEGWIIEGFENRATIATYYNFEWMPRFVEAMGYGKDVDYFVYKIPVPKEMPEFYTKVYERTQRRGNFVIHEFTRRKDLKPWIVPIFTLMNEMLRQHQHLRLRPAQRKGDAGPGQAVSPGRRPALRQGRDQGRRAGRLHHRHARHDGGDPEGPGPAAPVRLPQGPEGGPEDEAARPPPRRDQGDPTGAWAWTP